MLAELDFSLICQMSSYDFVSKPFHCFFCSFFSRSAPNNVLTKSSMKQWQLIYWENSGGWRKAEKYFFRKLQKDWERLRNTFQQTAEESWLKKDCGILFRKLQNNDGWRKTAEYYSGNCRTTMAEERLRNIIQETAAHWWLKKDWEIPFNKLQTVTALTVLGLKFTFFVPLD